MAWSFLGGCLLSLSALKSCGPCTCSFKLGFGWGFLGGCFCWWWFLFCLGVRKAEYGIFCQGMMLEERISHALPPSQMSWSKHSFSQPEGILQHFSAYWKQTHEVSLPNWWAGPVISARWSRYLPDASFICDPLWKLWAGINLGLGKEKKKVCFPLIVWEIERRERGVGREEEEWKNSAVIKGSFSYIFIGHW